MVKKILNSMFASVAVIAMVLSLVGATTASALTASDIAMLQAAGIINASQAASLSASITTAPVMTTGGYAFTRDLELGAKGDDVTALQQILISGGYMTSGYPFGYFGGVTKAALMKFQAAKGITPVAGYFGAKSRAALSGTSVTTGGTTMNPTGTSLNVSLAPTSPIGGAIIAGQAAATFAEFTFTNTSATPAVVTNVTLARTGVSADTSLSNVYLYQGAVRLTDGATVSSGKITFNASTGLFTVPAGSSVTIAVKSDIYSSAAAGQNIAVSLTGVTSNVSVAATYPVGGALFTVASAGDIATVSLGTVTNPVASASTINVQAGTLSQTIWASALSITQRSVWLKSLAVKVIGSVPSNSLQNIQLYAGGIQVATAAGVDANGMITFDLTANPYKIDSSRTLEIRSDIVNGASRSFSVSLQNAADLNVVDSNYNVGIAATSGIPASTGSISVTNGTVSVTLDSTLNAGDVVTGSSNVALGRYTLKAYGEDMKISYLYVGSTDQLDNVALYANGVQIGSTQTIAATSSNISNLAADANAKLFNLGSSLIIPAGTSVTVEVRGDIKYNGTNATTTSNTIQVSLGGYTNNAQGSYSQQLSTIPTLAGTPSVIMTVRGAGLTVGKNTAYTNQTAVPNTAIKLGSYTLQTTSAEPVRITSLVVTLGGAAGTSTNVSNLYVAVPGSTQANTAPINPSTSGSNNLSVNFQIPANGTQVVDVYGSLSSLTSGVASTTLALSGYGVNSNVVISQTAVTGQSVTVGSGTLAAPTKFTTSPDAQLVIGGASAKIVDYNFVTTNGDSTITKLVFAVTGPITAITVGNSTGQVVNGVATLTGLSQVVPLSQGPSGKTLSVIATYSPVDGTNVASLQNASTSITGMDYTSGNSNVSTTTLITTPSNTMVVVASKPSIAIANGGGVENNGSGTKVLANITVSADSAGDVSLMQLPISITTTGASSTSAVVVYVNGVQYTSITGGIATVGANTTATGTITFTGGYPITAGQPVTFSLKSNVTVPTDGSIQTSLGASSLFIWNDNKAGAVGLASTTGARIVPYPTSAATISSL